MSQAALAMMGENTPYDMCPPWLRSTCTFMQDWSVFAVCSVISQKLEIQSKMHVKKAQIDYPIRQAKGPKSTIL